MPNKKRYSVTIDMHIFAEDDLEAKYKAAKLAKKIDVTEGNNAQTLSVYETPFGSLYSRNVHTGRLTIFENKLIEV